MPFTGLEIPENPFPHRFFLKMVLGTHHGSSRPKMGFSARNGRTCVTPQALASTEVLDTFGQLVHEKLAENLKIGLPEPKLNFGAPNPIISPP